MEAEIAQICPIYCIMCMLMSFKQCTIRLQAIDMTMMTLEERSFSRIGVLGS